LNPVIAKKHAANADGNLNHDPDVIAFLQQCLRLYNAGVGSSERICAFTLLEEPPSLAAGEITDKAYINQRAVLINRAAQMELIYSSEPCGQVIVI
jgi:feruloyl-CoA synthase